MTLKRMIRGASAYSICYPDAGSQMFLQSFRDAATQLEYEKFWSWAAMSEENMRSFGIRPQCQK